MLDEYDRLKNYINKFQLILNEVKKQNLDKKIKEIVDLSERYCNDAKFYFERNDVFTSLTCIAYAEGLLDCLRLLNILDFRWESDVLQERKRRVLIAGTFDIIHPGHLWLIEKAKEFGRVIVLVSTDKNVERFKGRKPVVPSDQRLITVKGLKYVDEVFLGSESEDILKKVEEIHPDIIILGPDQNFVSEDELRKKLMERGLNVEVIRIKEEYKNAQFYKTSQIIHEIIKRRKDLENGKNK
ncbi:MAG: cytidylyltransferase family protein [Candidatus Methanomethylicia archaeon]|nr:cytidylyltransferase family protein [Candidatus Methanomethylicia archaeon]MCX8169099.1 cytidylyltransferase family protein [Candidatus Methanomethylicia archaeon]MDW7988831.1 DUF357 domain-containing protein [Nitrososphaerota archaeon]